MRGTRPPIRFSVTVDLQEQLLHALHLPRSPELLEQVERARCFGFWLFKPMLSMQKPSLDLHRTSQKECVMVVGGVRLGMSNVSVRVVNPAFIIKQIQKSELRQLKGDAMSMVDGLLPIALLPV